MDKETRKRWEILKSWEQFYRQNCQFDSLRKCREQLYELTKENSK